MAITVVVQVGKKSCSKEFQEAVLGKSIRRTTCPKFVLRSGTSASREERAKGRTTGTLADFRPLPTGINGAPFKNFMLLLTLGVCRSTASNSSSLGVLQA